MSNDSSLPLQPILSPCIGICHLDARGYCLGCHRTGDEIARWRDMSDAERTRYLNEVLPAREPAVPKAISVWLRSSPKSFEAAATAPNMPTVLGL